MSFFQPRSENFAGVLFYKTLDCRRQQNFYYGVNLIYKKFSGKIIITWRSRIMVLQKIANLPWSKKPRVGSSPTSSAFASPKFDIKSDEGGLRPIRLRLGFGEINPLMYYVYLLKCVDRKTYLGGTNNLKERLKRHQKGFIPATHERLPISLICYVAFQDKQKMFQFEKYLKSASGRAFLRKRFI